MVREYNLEKAFNFWTIFKNFLKFEQAFSIFAKETGELAFVAKSNALRKATRDKNLVH